MFTARRYQASAYLFCRDVHDATTSSMVTGRGLYAIDADQLLKIKPTVVVTQVHFWVRMYVSRACVCMHRAV